QHQYHQHHQLGLPRGYGSCAQGAGSRRGRIVPLRDSAPPCTVSSLLGMFPPEELSASHPVARPRRRSGRGAQGAFAPCSTLPLPADERPLEDLLRDLGVGE
ncbi:unnamed protein product, partial [Polarella glacialis]